ncbi:cytosine permease [Kutzneria buriramensis]|uniref:Purine-cytosine permease-like protein n=1 Tax=Kutzneria buriramensis TaxID=1045776 RepID=A0A3E0GUC4_9PSEU|nr:cytosine permease [Kutzneria buriramensis]REH26168.1 purine-cytosine permease-like protein [Kutzneria buriramensis]
MTESSAIEKRSIDWVPDTERHGKLWTQGPFWFMGNFQPFTVGIGLLGPTAFGLTVGQTALAGVLGILLGTGFMAFHASQGPNFGLPQMIQSRAQFGYRGVILALVATAFTFVMFNVVDVVILKRGLSGIFGWDPAVVAIGCTVLAAVIAIYGHDWLHRAFQILFWASLPLWLVLTVAIATGNGGGGGGDAGAFTWAGFLGMFAVGASYNLTYAPYVSDYSRYLPRDTKPASIVVSVFVGASASPIWLIPVGAWLGAKLGVSDALAGIYASGNHVVAGLGGVLTVLSVLVLVVTMGLNAYSGMLTVVTAADSLRPVNPTRRLRVVVILVLAVVWWILGSVLENASAALSDSLLVMLYLLAPWTAINLTDYFFVRRGHYAITDLFTPKGIYGAWNGKGILCLLLGVLVEIPFVVVGTDYVGFLAEDYLHGVDISWIISMAVAGGLYFLLTRGLDPGSEADAIQESERLLTDTGVAR